MFNKFSKISVLLIFLVFLVSACSLPWKKKIVSEMPAPIITEDYAEETVSRTNQIRKFLDYNELDNFLKENVSVRKISLSSYLGEELLTDNITSSVQSESIDHSTTNNQVVGVDEADIIKTDGEYIYALVRSNLKIIKAVPASEAVVVGEIDFKSRPTGFFINGKNISVFGVDEEIISSNLYQSFRRHNSFTFFKVFDLSDVKNPQLVRDLKFEGSYSDARMIGSYVYLITSSPANYFANEPAAPRLIENDQLLSSKCLGVGACYAPDVYYFDIPYESYNFTNVAAINMEDKNENVSGQSYLLSSGQVFYVSEKNIYITYTQYLNELEFERTVKRDLIFPSLTEVDQMKVSEIEKSPSYILSDEEKRFKTGILIDRYLNNLTDNERLDWQSKIDASLKNKLLAEAKNMETTVIHKIGIRGGGIEYRGFGSVNGRVLNQFSMDESDSYFRIATTRSQLWSRLNEVGKKSYNNVYILNNELKTIGSLENLALDEIIYSARFIGDRVYLVTFKQTDPLYVIDLADPFKPAVLGSIKIPGYSVYLHPGNQDGTRLIGLGRDAKADEYGDVKIGAIKLSLFDFSDLRSPKELDSYLIGDSSGDSIALYDHKAFLFSADKNLLAIPAVLRDNGLINFAGSLVFAINNNQLLLKGAIDHSDGGKAAAPDFWDSYNYYDNTVKRSLYIGSNIYTFSNHFLKINDLNTLNEIKTLMLTSTTASEEATKDDSSIGLPPAPINEGQSLEQPIDSQINEEAVSFDNSEESSPVIVPDSESGFYPEITDELSEDAVD